MGVGGHGSARTSLLRARVALVLIAAIPLGLAGCGIPSMDEPRPLATEVVPVLPTPGPIESPVPAGSEPALYFSTADELLRAVRRSVPTGTPSEQAGELLAGLMVGPSVTERAVGLSTSIPPGLTLQLTSLEGGHAVVDVAGEDPGPTAAQARLATGQVVLTLTALPGVSSVSLTRNGVPIEASLPDGSLTELPLTAEDYASLVAP